MFIVIVDTASKSLSLAIIDVESESCVAEYIDKTNENSHAKKINTVLRDLLNQNQISLKNIVAIALNQGPGSFTGLRVGSSSAKGLCFGLNIPMIAVDGLAGYARYLYNLNEENISDAFVLMDARRDNYFYSHCGYNKLSSPAAFKNIREIDEEIKLCSQPMVYTIEDTAFPKLSASYLSASILTKWKNKDFEDIRFFEPEYIVNNYISKK